MIKSCKKKVLFLIVISLQQIANAQFDIAKYEIGVSIGAFVYQGDLTPAPAGSFRTTRLNVALYGSRILSSSFSLRTNLVFGGLKGDEAKYDNPEFRKERAFNFKSPVFELTELIVWNPMRKNYSDKGLSPYLFAGGGIGFVKIKRDHSNFNAAYFGDGSDLPARIALDDAHSTPGIIPVVPVGLGLRYAVSPSLSVSAESSYRFVFTDYLDGFSQAANPAKDDHYSNINVGVHYKLGRKNSLGCPVMKY